MERLSQWRGSGDDDYFSSDLDNRLLSRWGLFENPVLVLPSGDDEFVPLHVDMPAVLEQWRAWCPQMSPLSDLIPAASHSVDDPQAQEWLAVRVVDFLASLRGRDGGGPARSR